MNIYHPQGGAEIVWTLKFEGYDHLIAQTILIVQ